MTPRMFSSTRKCWPSAFFGVTGSRQSEGGAPRWRRSCAASSVDRLAARLCERGERVDDVGRLVAACRGPAAGRGTGCRSRRGSGRRGTCAAAVAQARPPSGTSRCPRTRRSSRARAPPRAVPATRSSGGRPCRRNGSSAAAVSSPPRGCGSRPEARAPRRARAGRSNSRRCVGRARELAEPCRARLADGDRLRVLEQLAQLVDAAAPRASRPGADRCRAPRTRRRSASRSRARARQESIPVPIVTIRVTPALAGPLDEHGCGLVARVEVRVRVGHAVGGLLHPLRAPRPRPCPGRACGTAAAGSRSSCPAGSAARLPAPDPALVVAGRARV